MPSITFRLATPADEAPLRRLLRESPMQGSISLTYEREPNFFIAARMEGALSQTIVAAEDTAGAILGMGTRIVRRMYINGRVQEVGYMSHLRGDLNHSWGLSLARQLARSFGKFHELHTDGRVPFYLMSVIDDNLPARRLMTSELPGMPHAHEYAVYGYLCHLATQGKRGDSPARGDPARPRCPEHAPAILECLQRNLSRLQFSPFWSAENLFSPVQTPNLHPQDFFLATQSGRVVGCIALWDQTPFKQTVVRGYSGSMRRSRGVINLVSRIIDVPYLPPVGTPIRFCYASHLAIDDDNPRIFASLLRAAYNETSRRGFNYFMIGLSEANPLRAVLTKSYRHITYPSQIYLMAWEDGLDAIGQVDGRVPGPDVALL